MTRRIRWLCGGVAALLPLSPAYAHAYAVQVCHGDFCRGFLHPLTALEHLLPLLALALLAGQNGWGAVRRTSPLLLAGLVAGAVLDPWLLDAARVDFVNLASFLVLGGLVAAARPLPPTLCAVFGLFVGLAQGYANALATRPDTLLHLFVPGVAAAGMTAFLPVAVLVPAFKAAWQRVAVRVLGSWIAAIGIILTGLTLSRA